MRLVRRVWLGGWPSGRRQAAANRAVSAGMPLLTEPRTRCADFMPASADLTKPALASKQALYICSPARVHPPEKSAVDDRDGRS
jgi:hypothetical protein